MEQERWIDPKAGVAEQAWSTPLQRASVRAAIMTIPDEDLIEAMMRCDVRSIGCCFVIKLRDLFDDTGGYYNKVAERYNIPATAIQLIYYGVLRDDELAFIEECIADKLDNFIALNEWPTSTKLLSLMERDNAPPTY